MFYYKLTTPTDDFFLESKRTLSDQGVIRAMLDNGIISKMDADDATDVEEITESEYEENCF